MAGKRKKQQRWKKKLRQSVIPRIRKSLENLDVRIMTNVMVVVLLACVIAATVAWFTLGRNASVKGMQVTSGAMTDIEVSLTDDPWKDIGKVMTESTDTDSTQTERIKIEMPAFANIYDTQGNPVEQKDSKILAPGAYGTVTFYVKSVNENCRQCKIYIEKDFSILYDEDSDTKQKEQIKNQIDSIMNGHILCFGERTGTPGQYQYYQYLSKDTPLIIDLEYDTIKTVTLYWVWPYEYTNLLADCFADSKDSKTNVHLFCTPSEEVLKQFTDAQGKQTPLSDFVESSSDGSSILKMKEVYCWDKFDKELQSYRNMEDKDEKKQNEYLEDWYDYADTMIGSYVTDLSYKITVKGVMSDGQ